MIRPRLLLAALLLSGLAGAAGASVPCAIPAEAARLAAGLAAGIDAARAQGGLGPVAVDPALSRAAGGHACDMARGGFFGHRGSDGSDVLARARRARYPACLVAENLAWGHPRPEQVVAGWLQSPGHRRNMLDPRVREIGIGLATGDGGPTWVLVLAARC